eukprot:9189957-Pyramimonas_sp.AAC.1
MYTNAMFCKCPSSTHRGWALASRTRPVGLPQSSRCWGFQEPLGGLLGGFSDSSFDIGWVAIAIST